MESSISSLSRDLASSASTEALAPLLIFDPTSGLLRVDSTVEMYDSNSDLASCLAVKSLSA